MLKAAASWRIIGDYGREAPLPSLNISLSPRTYGHKDLPAALISVAQVDSTCSTTFSGMGT